MAKGTIITGLDIGSSKISVVVCHALPSLDGQMEIIGVGAASSKGLRRGVVADINLTAGAIREAISEAELMAGVNIESVCLGISGEHVFGQTSRGVVTVKNNAQITKDDVDRAVQSARTIAAIPEGHDILHVIEQNFIIDMDNRIKDPIGMSGSRLEANAYIITGNSSGIQSLLNSVESAEIPSVETLVIAPVASAKAVLQRDEREVGIALADIGDQTTEIIVYKEDGIEHVIVFPVGGQHITNDIAQYLKVTLPVAEELKLHRGCAWSEWVTEEDTNPVPITTGSTPPRFISRYELAQIIEYRMVQILEAIANELGDMQLPGGLVLTGGTALMDGLTELAEQILQLRVQVGYPKELKGLTDRVNYPMYSTSLGLAMYGEALRREEKQAQSLRRNTNWLGRFFRTIKEWFGY
ncbi:MAG: cell division protein FtsA [Candidatus Poribacteria bacterium]|nr:cell division protein FtsA [Candidatus Poribacteria bacterium]